MLYIECHRARVGLFQSRCLMNTEAATRGLFFDKVAGLKLWHSCFTVNFAKFLRRPSEHCFYEYLSGVQEEEEEEE